MPDISEIKGAIDGNGGTVLEGLVQVGTLGKWSHRAVSETDWTTTADVPEGLMPGTYTVMARFGRWTARMPRAKWDGARFHGGGAVTLTEDKP